MVRFYEHKRPFLSVAYDPPRLLIRQATIQGYAECPMGGVFDSSYPTSKVRRGRVQGGGTLAPTLTSASADQLLIFEGIN